MKRVMIVPYGTGIGDMVNMRPLAIAIARHFSDYETAMLCPDHLAWLVPNPVTPRTDSAFLQLWKRREADSPLAARFQRIPGSVVASFMTRISPVLAASLSRYLRAQGYDLVVNFLKTLASLDLSERWTPGPWSEDRRHIIDLMCEELEMDGIVVAARDRVPVLEAPPRGPACKPYVVLQPRAGAGLKSPAESLWAPLVAGLTARGFTPLVLRPPGVMLPSSLTGAVRAENILCATDLREVVSILAGAGAVISPDTGVLHLAAAAATRYVGLYGPTDPEFLGPYDRALGECLLTTTRHEESCRFCWAAQLFPACGCALGLPGGCMPGIEVEAVLRAFDRVMAGETAG